MSPVEHPLSELVRRFDPRALPVPRRGVRVRLNMTDGPTCDALLERDGARIEQASEDIEPDAELIADAATWRAIARDLRGGMDSFRRGRLRVRRNLHWGIGLLAATTGDSDPARLAFARVNTRCGVISLMRAGQGEPVVMIHGLGASKASFMPTIAALTPKRQAIAIDLPGFGDSVKPIGVRYDAPYFAKAVVALLDALEIEQAQLAGNSMGGRVALEVALRYPERVSSLGLLSPSLAWLKPPPWARALKIVRPELGLIQPAPRAVVERMVRSLVPGAGSAWVDAGVDEFLRAYYTPRGRAAFYAAARNIPLEAADGDDGFWTRLKSLSTPALFVWGRRDPLVPIGFKQHVERAVPNSEHLVLDSGHVPQLERPEQTHRALERFFGRHPVTEAAAAA